MAQVLVVYPSGPSFDLDYYLTKHMPLVASKWGSHGLKNYKILTFQEGAPFQIQATLEWESLEVFEKAAASEAAAAVFGDIKNFYDGNPVLLKGPVVASETVASSPFDLTICQRIQIIKSILVSIGTADDLADMELRGRRVSRKRVHVDNLMRFRETFRGTKVSCQN
ncbi:hypothetical protein FOQG_14011 [Fusarium oxysporum f. sp. raphani 54005]|uniref:EthD domain-containing protein n=6 Tax=Fusarium oxysporum TaxID=5507 RepID=X0BRP7_FUSOX|nr:hypothetical protein FOZG_13144 [Fusarium oxysporum Fo47]EWZ83562.1 hypothetical protein FOWG_13430 [Fusarium oxysporum f. sp. lycopersici MN25]EXK81598.1 hypothetical protein FOQG_14011 [Fusarium oxysporum f. sp. raphani 54005]EXL40461.1 hypothetical protein FOCG_16900 [Fusarium oxysporum f. sp. radicis-lycopersici 26381]EXM16701.1 hypothetical protein FOTG_15034 [Fusarium oxysporum f. sp. vasinfectum 25433]